MPTIFDDYIANAQPEHQATLAHVRDIIYKQVPNITEGISYGMPAFKYNAKTLLWVGNFKHHMSLFPEGTLVAEFGDKLNNFTVARGTIQFTVQNPLPDKLLHEIIARRIEMLDAATK